MVGTYQMSPKTRMLYALADALQITLTKNGKAVYGGQVRTVTLGPLTAQFTLRAYEDVVEDQAIGLFVNFGGELWAYAFAIPGSMKLVFFKSPGTYIEACKSIPKTVIELLKGKALAAYMFDDKKWVCIPFSEVLAEWDVKAKPGVENGA